MSHGPIERILRHEAVDLPDGVHYGTWRGRTIVVTADGKYYVVTMRWKISKSLEIPSGMPCRVKLTSESGKVSVEVIGIDEGWRHRRQHGEPT
jgi:hypothetical protein